MRGILTGSREIRKCKQCVIEDANAEAQWRKENGRKGEREREENPEIPLDCYGVPYVQRRAWVGKSMTQWKVLISWTDLNIHVGVEVNVSVYFESVLKFI